MNEDIVIASIRVHLTPADIGWTVRVDATLRASPGSSGDILFQLAVSPLSCQSLESSRGHVSQVQGATEGERFFLLHLDDALGETWDGASIRMVFEWCPRELGPCGTDNVRLPFETPCLVLPDMLPHLVMVRNTLPSPRSDKLCRVTLEGELPAGLEMGWVGAQSNGADDETTYLQLVVFESLVAEHEASGVVRLGLARAAATAISPAQAVQAYRYSRPLLNFLARELPTPASLKAVLCLSSTKYPPLSGPVGAYAVVAPDRAGAREVNVGSPTEVVLMLAQSWANGGLRLTGENEVELRMAVGGAFGLRWLQYMELHEPLERAITKKEAAVREARATGNWRLMHKGFAIQLSLFRALESATVRETLRSLIADHWGHHLPQEIFVEQLRKAGVSVPAVYM